MTSKTVRLALHVALVLSVVVTGGCARQVTRIAPEQALDLSGRWNDVDSRLVADAMIEQSFASGWVAEHMRSKGGEVPAVLIGSVRNSSLEHIPLNTFVRDLERAYVNSGQVRVVAGGTERDELRVERGDQQVFASAPSRSQPGMEQGAAYMLQGEIQSIEDREGRRKVVFYQVDLSLIDIQSNTRVWVGQHKIKKYVEEPRVRI
jgi:penicillin-binding protein activator